MKKVIKTITIAVLAVSFLLIASFGTLIVYARNNIDYDFDEAMFNNAKVDRTPLQRIPQNAHGDPRRT